MTEGEQQYRLRLSNGTEFGPGNKDMILQWCREGRIPKDALLVPIDGGEPVSVFSMPELEIILNTPPIVQGAVIAPKSDSDATGGLIPYKNQPALIGYYFSVFSLIPVIALLLGPIAFILGIIGLRKRMKNPAVRGIAHAWVAIILGLLTTVGNISVIVMMFVAASR